MPWPKLFDGVNQIEDLQSLSDLEKKHAPIISAPASVKANEFFNVTVEVGKMLGHPNEMKHFIEFVELYADDRFLARADFTAETVRPEVTFSICLPGPIEQLRAFERCNVHGTWEWDSPVEVSE